MPEGGWLRLEAKMGRRLAVGGGRRRRRCASR